MDHDEKFNHQRLAFRLFIADLEPKELLFLIEDINKILDYKLKIVDSYLDRNKFNELMERSW